jgi:hypothetical protein
VIIRVALGGTSKRDSIKNPLLTTISHPLLDHGPRDRASLVEKRSPVGLLLEKYNRGDCHYFDADPEATDRRPIRQA